MHFELIYIVTFLLSLPLVWNILYAFRFETLFKQGRVMQIRIAFLVATFIFSHLLAQTLYTFLTFFYNLF